LPGAGGGFISSALMHNPFELVTWAIAIAISWMILTSLTGCEDWIKNLLGRKDTHKALNERIAALEIRVKELEQKR
jgi:hypothetical protein